MAKSNLRKEAAYTAHTARKDRDTSFSARRATTDIDTSFQLVTRRPSILFLSLSLLTGDVNGSFFVVAVTKD